MTQTVVPEEEFGQVPRLVILPVVKMVVCRNFKPILPATNLGLEAQRAPQRESVNLKSLGCF